MKKLIIIIPILILLVIGGISLYYSLSQNNIARYLVVDINPSLEMGLSKDNEVLSVTPLNSDADILLSDIDLIGLNVEQASQEIIGESIETGFIDEYDEDNIITIYSTDEDEDLRDNLQTAVVEKVSNSLEKKGVHALVVSGGLTDEMKAEADTYGVSYGRFLLVSRLASITNQYTKEDIINMSVKEIQLNIKTLVNQRRSTISENEEELKTELRIQKQEKIKEYEQKKKQLEATLLNEYQKQNGTTLTDREKSALKTTLLEQKKEKIKIVVDKVIKNIEFYQNKSNNKQIDSKTIKEARKSTK